MIVGDTMMVFTTEDGGRSWQQLPPSALSGINFWAQTSFKAKAYNIFGDTAVFVSLRNPRHVYRITQFGKKWEQITISPTSISLWSAMFYNSKVGVGLVLVDPISNNKRMYALTQDGGYTWDTIGNVRTSITTFANATTNTPAFHLAYNTNGSWISYDTCKNWVNYDTLKHSYVTFYHAELGISSIINTDTSVFNVPGGVRIYNPNLPHTYLKKNIKRSEKVILYPNPTNGLVQFSQNVSQVEVVNIHGQVCAQFDNTSAIDISKL